MVKEMAKQSFEERLIALSGAENLAEAKQLLKKKQLSGGAWRDRNNLLCGQFKSGSGVIDTAVETGENPKGFCSCGKSGHPFCEHAAALVMYAGRFSPALGIPDTTDEIPTYYAGLKKEPFSKLSEKLKNAPRAELTLDVQSSVPHVPSKWENIIVSVTLRNREKEYLGNLNNLRQLYFDKSLSVILKFEHFSLQEQQIIRFLATNGEADSSKVSLDAELTTEFFHILIGFERFFRNGRQIIVRGNHIEPVIIKKGRSLTPGIRTEDAVLPVSNAKVVAGRAGCWIGRDSEYYFLPGIYEIGFIRNFFRTGVTRVPDEVDIAMHLNRFPFKVVNQDISEPEIRQGTILLDGQLLPGEGLFLNCRYIYPLDDHEISCRMRSGEFITDNGRFWKRDIAFERKFELALQMAGFEVHSDCAILRGDDAVGLFLDKILPEYLAAESRLSLSGPLGLLLRGGIGVPEATFHCQLAEKLPDAFKISYTLSCSGISFDCQDVIKCAAEHRTFLALTKVGMVKLPESYGRFFRAFSGAVRKLDTVQCTFEVPFYNVKYYLALAEDIPGAVVPQMLENNYPATPPAPTFHFKGKLRSYQQQGVDFICRMTDSDLNVILADEMGLGKTVQLLAVLAARLHKETAPALIVCPASLITNWEREAKRFVPELCVFAPRGAERNEFFKHPEKTDLLILSYTAARISREQLKKTEFSYLVLDEAQHIKNPGSGNARSCKDLAARHRIVLSGTPLENSQEDLWSIMDFLHPGMLGTLASFRKRYAGIQDSEELRNDLAKRIGPFIKRRTKKEVTSDLPERTEKIIYCDFLPEQKKLYDKVLADGRKELAAISRDDRKSNMTIFTILLRLRQICCAPELLPDNLGANIPSAKTELLKELLQENIDSSHKMLLFSQFTSLLQLLIPELEKSKIAYEYLDGSTRDRMKHVDNFNQSPDIPLFLLSLKAGGTGLNLTSADTVIIYDPWWNPATELQAADRSHRIGQKNPVTICRLVIRDSVEEKILELQGRKKELFDSIVDAQTSENALSLEELRCLLD